MKNIQDIIKCREITDLGIIEFGALKYQQWQVEPPIFSDMVEGLLESGFLMMVDHNHNVIVFKIISPSPTQIQQNKHFLHTLMAEIDGVPS